LAESQSRKAEALNEYLTKLLEQAGDFVAKGKNPEALRLAVNESVKEVKLLQGEPELQAELLDRQAQILMAMGDYRSALPLVQQQYDVLKGLYGEHDPRTLTVLLKVARSVCDVGDKPEALRLYTLLEKAWQDLGPKYDEQRHEVARYHARELARQGRGKEGLALIAAQGEGAGGGKETSWAALLLMADIQLGMGELSGAERNCERVLQLMAHLPPEKATGRSLALRTLSRVKAKQQDYEQAALHLEESIRLNSLQGGAEHYSLVGRWIEVAHHYMKTKRTLDAFRAADEALQITRAHGNDLSMPRALRAAAEVREAAHEYESALAFRRECMERERLHNTDRGKWIYELSQIVRLESLLNLYDDLERDAVLLWQQCQTEPAVTTDPRYKRSLCQGLINACEKWQKDTGKVVFQEQMLEWKTITTEGVVQQ